VRAQNKRNNSFRTALFFSLVLAAICGFLVLLLGRDELFFLINGQRSRFADIFFRYYTYAGSGWMWVPLGVYCIFFRRNFLAPVIAGILISTILSQFLKRVVFPGDLRPITYLSPEFPVYYADGETLNRLHSFPSGHTATAFTMAILLSLILDKKSWSLVLPVLAGAVGYSRVYLAQHFPTDVLAGLAVGILSAYLSFLIFRYFEERKKTEQKE